MRFCSFNLINVDLSLSHALIIKNSVDITVD